MCDTTPIKLGFVVAEFNRDITYMMEIEGREHAAFLGAEVTECLYVPGAYDMPLAIKKMLQAGKVDAVVTIGCVIEGATQHDDIVVQHAARKIIDLSLDGSVGKYPRSLLERCGRYERFGVQGSLGDSHEYRNGR